MPVSVYRFPVSESKKYPQIRVPRIRKPLFPLFTPIISLKGRFLKIDPKSRKFSKKKLFFQKKFDFHVEKGLISTQLPYE